MELVNSADFNGWIKNSENDILSNCTTQCTFIRLTIIDEQSWLKVEFSCSVVLLRWIRYIWLAVICTLLGKYSIKCICGKGAIDEAIIAEQQRIGCNA